jgi:hypothetical protein
LPRLGRSHTGTGSDETGSDADCCTSELKTEWVMEDGKRQEEMVCEAQACCPGYKEIFGRKPNGVFYSMCTPNPVCPRGKRSALVKEAYL